MRSWTADDSWHFHGGRHDRLHEVLGADCGAKGRGGQFRAWVPDVDAVSLIGDFTDWAVRPVPMTQVADDIWEATIDEARAGDRYKLRVHGIDGVWREKADPFASWTETPPLTASRLGPKAHRWADAAWMKRRPTVDARRDAIALYEVHLGSFAAGLKLVDGPLYRTVAPHLIARVKALGFTHVELMPVMEHPYGPSWGYQVTSFFAPTSRWGDPSDLAWMIDALHAAGIGVVLDWVPAHFPTDAHGLYRFHGGPVFEHPDPRRGWHPDWTTAIFDYGRPEVRSFLLSSACCWIERFHADGIRVDAVSSMLYLDYSRKAGEWLPNVRGGNTNDEAVSLMSELNELLGARFPGVLRIAEESTAWPGVTRKVSDGGLGFDMKWDLGWMNDTLHYLAREPIYRPHHHNELTFRSLYRAAENYLLPLSHDEVVHGKGSLLGKMPGDPWQRFANVRLLLSSMFAQPGKKLLFMGDELAPDHEWSLEWGVNWTGLEAQSAHAGVALLVRDLLTLMRASPALHERDAEELGFQWIDADDSTQSVLAFLRWDSAGKAPIAFVANHTATSRRGYRLGVPTGGAWRVLLDTDFPGYGGTGLLGRDKFVAEAIPSHGMASSFALDLPPLGALFLTPA